MKAGTNPTASTAVSHASRTKEVFFRVLPALVALAGIIGLFVYIASPRTLLDALAQEMPVEDGIQVVSIEKMEAGKHPENIAVDPDSEVGNALCEAITSSKTVYKRNEFGAPLDNILYTLTVQDKKLGNCYQMLTFDVDGNVYMSSTGACYTLPERNEKIYTLCEAVFIER